MAALDADGAPLMVMSSVLAGSVADGSSDMSMSSVLAGDVAEDSPEMDMSSVTESSVPAVCSEGHELDADTVALWRFDETVHRSYTTAAEANGNYPATQSTATRIPTIVGGAGGTTDYARWFGTNNVDRGMDFTPDATMTTALVTDDWTCEAWVYLEEYPSGDALVIDIGGPSPDADPNNNFLLRWEILSTGLQQVFWESGGGVNRTVTQTVGTAIPLRTWTYIAITGDTDGVNRSVEFFVDSGTPQDSGSDTTATGGSNATGAIGYTTGPSPQVDAIDGAISQLRLSTTIRSSTELNDNATNPAATFANDGSTLALWQFQEPPEVIDVSANGYHLAPATFGTDLPRIVDPLIPTGGQARTFEETGEVLVLRQQEPVRQLLLGEYTLEVWGRLRTPTTNHGLLLWAGSGETPPTNQLIDISIDYSAPDYVLEVFWELGAGINLTQPSVTTSVLENFALTDGQTLTVSINGGPDQTATFNTGDFVDINNATAAEVAAVINTDVSNVFAEDFNGAVRITSTTTPTSIQITGGDANPVLVFTTDLITPASTTMSVPLFTEGEEGDLYPYDVFHLAVVFKNVGNGNRNVLIYRNATLLETLGPFPRPTEGTLPGALSYYGLTFGGAEDGGSQYLWEGLLDDSRLSSVARTAEEIQSSYDRGVTNGCGTSGGGATVFRQNPEVTRSSP